MPSNHRNHPIGDNHANNVVQWQSIRNAPDDGFAYGYTDKQNVPGYVNLQEDFGVSVAQHPDTNKHLLSVDVGYEDKDWGGGRQPNLLALDRPYRTQEYAKMAGQALINRYKRGNKPLPEPTYRMHEY